MIEFFENATYWHWLIAGLLLTVMEVLAPGVIFLWLGVAAFAVGILLLAGLELTWQNQFIVFGLLSVISVIAGRYVVKKRPTETDQPALNQRGQQYIGRSFVLKEAMVDGVGKLVVDDTHWKISGETMAAGTKITVVSVDGMALNVEKAE